MELNQSMNSDQTKPNFSTVQSTIEYFLSKGAKLGNNKGSILMPLSKKQKESMKK